MRYRIEIPSHRDRFGESVERPQDRSSTIGGASRHAPPHLASDLDVAGGRGRIGLPHHRISHGWWIAVAACAAAVLWGAMILLGWEVLLVAVSAVVAVAMTISALLDTPESD